MLWPEYFNNKGIEVPPQHYAIDLLMEEPALFRQQAWKFRGEFEGKGSIVKFKPGSEEVDSEEASTSHLKKLPERIRINAAPLCEALSATIGEGALTYRDKSPIVMRSPFRFLLYHEERIRRAADRETTQDHKANVDNAKSGHLNDPQKANIVTGDHRDTGDKISPEILVPESQNSSISKLPQQDKSNEEMKTPNQGKDHDGSIDKKLAQQLNLLLSVIQDFIKPTVERVKTLQRVTFQELYYLFRPGDTIYVGKGDQPQKLWRVLQVTGGNRLLRPFDDLNFDEQDAEAKRSKRDNFSPLALECFFLSYDGFRFRRVHARFTIPSFPDSQSVQNLPVIPFEIAKQANFINEEDIRCGAKQYLDCTQPSHRSYKGKSVEKDPQGRRLKIASDDSSNRTMISETVEGAVMVDFEKAYQYNPAWLPNFEDLEDYKSNPREIESVEDKKREVIQDDLTWDMRLKEEFLDKEAWKIEKWEQREVSDDDALTLPDRLPAFVLRSRKWGQKFYLRLGFTRDGGNKEEVLTKIEVKRTAWDDLQLPGDQQDHGHKYVIQSLVDKHFSRNMHLDLIKEKGRGLIILLHGAPGVGKTSTAECVAEARGKPLLPITCGDLGLEPEQVEARLSLHFELAQSWDCILLLDEADVFLAARSLQDLQRNALVSVFLRILEYYEGILFLTTNKIGLIDEAFKSRIHMSLYYPWLSKDQTTTIWRSLLQRARASQHNLSGDETDILLYAMELYQNQTNSEYGRGPDGKAPGWNGRQIRNAFMSAISLAQYEARRSLLSHSGDHDKEKPEPRIFLTREHFKTVAHAWAYPYMGHILAYM
ncbi:MAG: hypothetical protein Q9165_008929, partial [Trypethelium subeluteriae]